MKLNYYPETDSLYIDLSARPSAESREVSEVVVLDYDELEADEHEKDSKAFVSSPHGQTGRRRNPSHAQGLAR